MYVCISSRYFVSNLHLFWIFIYLRHYIHFDTFVPCIDSLSIKAVIIPVAAVFHCCRRARMQVVCACLFCALIVAHSKSHKNAISLVMKHLKRNTLLSGITLQKNIRSKLIKKYNQTETMISLQMKRSPLQMKRHPDSNAASTSRKCLSGAVFSEFLFIATFLLTRKLFGIKLVVFFWNNHHS